ncbi:ATP-binding protein [Nocardia sp. BMG111209]|uniref:ATP-binding protein n=1 Tax=Nocardia sp. BMG111209 TaxID=1160137 RepID=UPI00036438E0|nr:ATP-binding protein [Nocardia sp. BMG111209]
MNQTTAVTISWILAACLVLAVTAALYATYYAARQHDRAEAARRALQTRAEELEHFTGSTMRYLSEAARRGEVPHEKPVVSTDPEFAHALHRLADNYIHDLHRVHAETRDLTLREAEAETRAAVARTEQALRGDVETSARDATGGAVRAFGTSVVSIGADVSQVVSVALRRHRSDAVYETLIHIDHSVQQMIHLAQSYVIVCGGLPGRRWPRQLLTDVVGGAIGRVREYTRVRPQQLDRIVVSRAVEPLVHTLATLLDNALRYSPPNSYVDVSFQEGHHGVTVLIDDAGVRMNADQLEETREVLSGDRVVDVLHLGLTPRVGFPGVAALARRYGFTVHIDGPNAYGGMRAMVFVPETLLTPQESPVPTPEVVTRKAEGSGQEPSIIESETVPPSVPEITNGGLPRRRRRAAALSAVPHTPETSAGYLDDERPSGPEVLPRPEIAAEWRIGSQTGRAAAYEHTEG